MTAALPPTALGVNDWVSVAAGQTDAIITKSGTAGSIGDYLDGILVIPTTTAAGAVTIKDGGTQIGGGSSIWDGGGTTALVTLVPFYIPIGARSRISTGGWTITTGANVRVVALGSFSS